MGRIRTIKPEILTDPKATRLSDLAWRLWVSTWVIADDLGRCPADPLILGGQCIPGRALTEVSGALSELSLRGLVRVYEVNGDQYLEISGFQKHQKICRPSGPKFPAPCGEFTEPSVSPHGALDADRDHDHDHDHDRDRDISVRDGKATRALPEESLRVADALRDAVLAQHPEHRLGGKYWTPARRKAWARTLDLAHRRDGRSWVELEQACSYLGEQDPGDRFRLVVESAAALREKFDRITAAQARCQRGALVDDRGGLTPRGWDSLEAVAAEYDAARAAGRRI